jgi:hypothetical protein
MSPAIIVGCSMMLVAFALLARRPWRAVTVAAVIGFVFWMLSTAIGFGPGE